MQVGLCNRQTCGSALTRRSRNISVQSVPTDKVVLVWKKRTCRLPQIPCWRTRTVTGGHRLWEWEPRNKGSFQESPGSFTWTEVPIKFNYTIPHQDEKEQDQQMANLVCGSHYRIDKISNISKMTLTDTFPHTCTHPPGILFWNT